MTLRRFFTLILLLACTACLVRSARAATPLVVVVHLQDTVQPVSEAYLARALTTAADEHAAAVIIELDTPGGLLTSMRAMTSRILSSPVPIIVYVGPTGARAGSAGFFLLEAADVAAMAPGTNAGAAHPVVEGAKLDDTMKMKLENDTAAFLRSYTAQRGRNPSAAEDAVRQSKSYTAKEAKDLNLIDLVAPDLPSLLADINGRTITRFNGTKAVLDTHNARLSSIDLTTREHILDWFMDPNIAVLILIFGALLIYVEFNAPGTIIPGALGTLLVLLSLFALNLLPIHFASALLLLAAFALFLLEFKFASHGVLAAAGIVCLVIGLLTLVNGPIPELRVRLGVALATGIGFGIITLFLVRIAMAARRNKVVTGSDALIGMIAVATDPLLPNGQIMLRGELWQARSEAPVGTGERVRVTARKGLVLSVERLP